MRKRLLTSLLFLGLAVTGIQAQRVMDVLDRGLVAQMTPSGVFVSWRINVEEWYDVKYNLYRDGIKLNAEPLNVSNFTDTRGSQTSKYTVKTVFGGVERNDACPAVSPFADGKPYLSIKLPPVMNPMIATDGKKQRDVSYLYQANDCSAADLDGDGRLEIIVKRANNDTSIEGDTACTRFEVYDLDGHKRWQVDCGPNMVNMSNVESNMIAADYDGDGKSEVICRLGEGAVLNDGTILGPQPVRHMRSGDLYQRYGEEYLVLLDGATGKLLDYMHFPLERKEIVIWGKDNDSAHRANKFFFGAPYLDGRHPSLFLGRGIYHRIEMAAYDIVNKKFVQRWKNPDPRYQTEGTGYFGCGFHNYAVADTDFDGKDEIVYGSSVADDNGMGLCTNYLGHGDAQHIGDLDPFRKGLEQFTCNEDNPGTTLYDPMTGKFLWRTVNGSDVGRAIAANVSDAFDGYALQGNGHFASATEKCIDPNCPDQPKTGSLPENFALYWKGNLLQSGFNYDSFDDANGMGILPTIYDYEDPSKNLVLEGCITNNHTKGNPCMQIDLFGDWREELIMRTPSNDELRIYTTNIPTAYRVYTLLGDKQYKNSIVWQMCGYNQPPHVSFFLGQREGITVPPPPETVNGREERTTEMTAADNDKHVILCQMEGGTTAVNGATPRILTINSPKDYTLDGQLSGTTRLVKQGWGTLNLSGDHTHAGLTDIWEGQVNIVGNITQSTVWMNRFTEMNLTGDITAGLTQEFSSVLRVDKDNTFGTVNIGSLTLKKGAIVRLDILSDGTATESNDLVKVKNLDLKDGAVLCVIQHNLAGAKRPAPGEYKVMTYETLTGDVNNVKLDGLSGLGATITARDHALYVKVPVTRPVSSTLAWDGSLSNVWDVNATANFYNLGSQDKFIADDAVEFDDYANSFDVRIGTSVEPASVTFLNEQTEYTLTGDSIVGNGGLLKKGAANVTIKNVNRYRGGTVVEGGQLTVNSFGNTEGVEFGSTGHYTAPITIRNGAALSTTGGVLVGDQPVVVGDGGAVISVKNGAQVTLRTAATSEYGRDGVLVKRGQGKLIIGHNNALKKLVVEEGDVENTEGNLQFIVADEVELAGGNYYDHSNLYSYTKSYQNISVREGTESKYYLDSRCDYYGKLTGKGSVSVFAAGPRNYTYGDWSEFEGTVSIGLKTRGSDYDAAFTWDNDYGLPKATLNIYSGVYFQAGNRNVTVGNLMGSGVLKTTGRVTLGGLNEDMNYQGSFEDCAVTKTGTGNWEIKSAMTGMTALEVRQGEFRVNNTKAIDPLLGNIMLTVRDEGVLRGRGYLYDVEVLSGGSIAPGNYTNAASPTGELKVHHSLVCAEGSNVDIFVAGKNARSSNTARFTVLGSMQMNGTINITLKDTYVPAAGDSIVIWNVEQFTGSPKLNLPQLPEGLEWNTDELCATTGKLRIVSSTAIRKLHADELADGEVFSASGVQVGRVEAIRVKDVQRELQRRGLPAGTYVVRLGNGQKSDIRKVVVR